MVGYEPHLQMYDSAVNLQTCKLQQKSLYVCPYVVKVRHFFKEVCYKILFYLQLSNGQNKGAMVPPQRWLLAGKASSRQARVMRRIIITMRGVDTMTSIYIDAGRNTCRVLSNIHTMRGSVLAGRKQAGGGHAGRHHHTKIG